MIFWISLPVVLFAATAAGILLYYNLRLGHGPDVRAYFDAVLAFSGTDAREMTATMQERGVYRTIVVILLAYLTLAVAARAVARLGIDNEGMPLVLGLLFGCWAIGSYPVGEPWVHGIFRLLPFVTLSLAIVVAFLLPRCISRCNADYLTFFGKCCCSVFWRDFDDDHLSSLYNKSSNIKYYARSILSEDFIGLDVSKGLPMAAKSLNDIMVAAHVNPDDPIFYAGGMYGEMMPKWIPLGKSNPVVVSTQWMLHPCPRWL